MEGVLKVLMFGWEFPPHNSGGLGTACLGLSTALAKKHQLTFVLPKKVRIGHQSLKFDFGDSNQFDLEVINSLLRAYANPHTYKQFLVDGEISYGQSLLDEVDRYAHSAKEVAQRSDHQVIHAHDWLSFGAGIAAKEETGRPLVAHVHATEFDRTGGEGVNQQVYEKEREGLEIADRVIAVSHYTKSILIKHYGVAEQKVDVVHNGVVPFETVGSGSIPFAKYKKFGYKIVLFVGRITIQKGPDYFLKAAAEVLKYRPKTLFLMVGSGDMAEQMIRLSVELGIANKVFFPGFLRGAELQLVYKVADLFVMPSVSEPFGITPLEAMLVGTPVLISKQSGVAEVIDHGLKADFWDTNQMANQIVSVLSSPLLQNSLSRNGRRNAQNQTWIKAGHQCSLIYKQLTGK